MECTHENAREVLDMPIMENGKYIGHFDVQWCDNCHSVISKESTNGG